MNEKIYNNRRVMGSNLTEEEYAALVQIRKSRNEEIKVQKSQMQNSTKKIKCTHTVIKVVFIVVGAMYFLFKIQN